MSDFQNGTGVANHSMMQAEHLISHTRSAALDTINSLHGSDGEIILVSEVHDVPNIICDLLNKSLFKWVGNITDI